MASTAAIGKRHHQALTELADILTKHDPEVGGRITRAKNGGGLPNPVKRPQETAAYHAECMRSLARIVDEQLTPKKRGRPRKAS